MIELATAARVLGQLRGRNAVKESMRRHGFKASSLRPAEINEWARLYVEDHAELREKALADARQMILTGMLGKRGRERFVQNSQVMHKTKPSLSQWRRLCRCQVQNEYARVSTDGQTLDAQHSALVNAGAKKVYSRRSPARSACKSNRCAC